MDTVVDILKGKLKDNPNNALLLNTITRLSDSKADGLSWDVLKHDFDLLEAQGLWEQSEENTKLLDMLRPQVNKTNNSTTATPSSSGSTASPQAAHPLPSIDPTILPKELVDILNHTYFLHIIATDPDKVLPPGKSLLSVLSRRHTSSNNHAEGPAAAIQAKVQDMVHKVFWDEALETLSDPSPSVVVPRLSLLYNDLHEALKPLLPPHHPVLDSLSSQLSPTSSPLRSALAHLRETLAALRERCAPARDAHIDQLVTQLNEDGDLPGLVTRTAKATLELAQAMQDDLSQFVVGSLGEEQIKVVLAQQARLQERDVILQLWRPDALLKKWSAWMEELEAPYTSMAGGDKLVTRVIQALGSTSPISCNLPVKQVSETGGPATDVPLPPNSLPPPFLFLSPSLLYIQNLLQALVIAASLRSLTRLPAPTSSAGVGEEFMQRIWSLLSAEISDSDDPAQQSQGETKLINLADEVVRAASNATSPIDPAEETRLRSAVERTLQTSDPVYILLQKRLLTALAERLVQAPIAQPNSVPERMQTGRDGERAGKRPRLALDLEDLGKPYQPLQEETNLVVKGFEDPVLVKAIGDILGRIRGVTQWVRESWEDLAVVDAGDVGEAKV